ncbi:neuropeptide Y receptor type 5 [Tupaia chinensis]|uniref:neuropeptide Y receptor type 5 n=1 Tax=Tupaia chinensis TaxID=246437 RepID=UPI0003C90AFA|nr:neuropeptide Y receptor type 5 [Tupaia chinensis]
MDSELREHNSTLAAENASAAPGRAGFPVWEDFRGSVDDLQYFLIGLYTLVSLLGFVGNLLILMALVKRRHQQTTVNFLIGNLAFSDILVVLFCSPFTLASVLLDRWLFGRVLCHVVPFLQCVSVLVSTLILMAIAVVRYHTVRRPLSSSLTANHGYFLIAAVWTLGLALCAPLPVFHRLVELRDTVGAVVCVEACPSSAYRVAFTLSLLLAQYVLPLLCLTASHAGLCRSLRCGLGSNAKVVPGVPTCFEVKAEENSDGPQPRAQRSATRIRKRSRSVVYRLTVLILVFAVSWMPLHLFHVVTDFNDSLISNRHFKLVYCVCHLLGMTSCCLNPLLYGFLNNGVKADLLSLTPCLHVS